MANPSRFQVVPKSIATPPAKTFEKRFLAFALRIEQELRGGEKLGSRRERVVKALADKAYLRHRQQAGTLRIDDEKFELIKQLAQNGAALQGPRSLHEVDELAAALHRAAPWMAEAGTYLLHAMRSATRDDRFGLSVPPMILVGAPGNGKSTYARLIADLAGVPAREIDVGSGSAAFRVAGTEKGWSTAQSGIPVETIFASRVANPLMIVNEIDKAGAVQSTSGSTTSIVTALLTMLEPQASRRFECPHLRLTFDMSRVNWILTANEEDAIPAPLRDRCRIVRMPKVTPVVAGQMFDRVAPDYSEIAPDLLTIARAEVLKAASQREISLRKIRRVLAMLDQPDPEALI